MAKSLAACLSLRWGQCSGPGPSFSLRNGIAMTDRSHDHRTHGTGHSHAGHGHGAVSETSEWRLAAAFLVIFVFTFVEAIGGILAGSLALLADAGHMVSDAAALGMSWLAMRVGRRPADSARSFGYKRLEVLAAFVNGCTLFVIAAGVVFEAVRRFGA